MSQPLRKYAYILAQRLGMLAGDLIERMSIIEIYDWQELDEVYCDESWYQHAGLCQRLDGIFGKARKFDDYLPIKKIEKPKTENQKRLDMMMNWMLAAKTIKRRNDV